MMSTDPFCEVHCTGCCTPPMLYQDCELPVANCCKEKPLVFWSVRPSVTPGLGPVMLIM